MKVPLYDAANRLVGHATMSKNEQGEPEMTGYEKAAESSLQKVYELLIGNAATTGLKVDLEAETIWVYHEKMKKMHRVEVSLSPAGKIVIRDRWDSKSMWEDKLVDTIEPDELGIKQAAYVASRQAILHLLAELF